MSARNPAPDLTILCSGFGGGGIPLVGGRLRLLLRPHIAVLPCGGALWSLCGRGGCWRRRWWVITSSFGGGPSFRHSVGPAHTWGEAELKHTCGYPRCVVHYETCIQSLMAQVQDLRTQNLELHRSQQELSQAVASTAGISQFYGDQMTQILSTLANSDAVFQGYQRESKAVEASVSDHLKMSNSNTAKCFSVVETLATSYAAVASRIDAWDRWYSTPAEPDTVVPPPPSAPKHVPDPEPAAPRVPMGAPSGPSGGGCVLPISVHPSQDCIYHPNACPNSGRPRRGEEHHEHPDHHNLLRGGEPPKSRRNLLSPSGGRPLRGKNTPQSLRPRGPVRRRTPLRWATSIP